MSAVSALTTIQHLALYLGIPFLLMVFWFQYHWAKTCNENVQVLVAQQGGGGRFMLAPKSGAEVTIQDPTNKDVTRTWPINELATIDVLYPGVGFVPAFMQKTIRLAIVNEGDWEPMLNRSPHRKKVASPDVLEFLRAVANYEKTDPDVKDRILEFIGGVSTGPTREMVADPSLLGSLMRSSVMRALATVSNDLTEELKRVTGILSKMSSVNPAYVYIGLGLIIIMLAFAIIKISTSGGGDVGALNTKVDLIMKSLGIAAP